MGNSLPSRWCLLPPLITAAMSLPAQTLAPVTITATRIEASPFDVPASISVIDGDRLRAAGRPEINLSESLALVPGVNARDRQNFAQDLQLSIRGFGARSTFGVRGVRIYVDGIPATMPDGQGQLSHIDLASVGSIELLRGPFSSLYGNSSGGVMQVFTHSGEGKPQFTASVAAGSDGLLRPGIRASGESGALRYTISANSLAYDGAREHSAVQRGVGNARLDYRSGEGRDWMLVGNTVHMRADDPLGLTRAQFESAPRSVDATAIAFNTRKTVRQDQVGVVHEARLASGDKLRAMVYVGQRDTEQFQAIPVAPQASALHPGGVIGLARTYAGADLRWTHGTDPLQVVAGLSWDTMREQRKGWQNFVGSTPGVKGALRRDESNEVGNLDPYLQAQWKVNTRWTLTAGIRHSSVRFSSSDHYVLGANGDDSGNARYGAILPAVAAMFALSPQLHAYAAAGRGFETPTFNELAYRPSGASGLNLALRPSRSNNVEVGLKGRSRPDTPVRLEWAAAVFDTRTRSEIVTQTNSGGRSTFTNAGATRRRGIELAWSTKWASAWQLQLSQSWLDARYSHAFATCAVTPCTVPGLVIAAGNRIPGTARSTTAMELAWQPAEGWRAGAEMRRSSRVWVNDANAEAAPAFSIAAMHVGYVWALSGWNMSAAWRIDNLFDRRYAGSVIVNEGNSRFYEPATGRSHTLKLSGSYAF